jgi:predicted glycosyltransferase
MDEISVPVRYTGYICEKSVPAEGNEIRETMRLDPDEKLIIVSAGGGNVGYELLSTALRAYDRLEFPATMQIFAGPYLDADAFATLKGKSIPGIHVERFTSNFPAWLQAADLSISMGGYNTTMNTLAAGTPALIHPFSQNREQRLRAEKLANHANLKILDEQKLSPGSIADCITHLITRDKMIPEINLNGPTITNQILSQWINSGSLP